MEEIFKPIKNYEGYYEISNKGRVRSTSYKGIRILKPCKIKNGYLNVILCVNQKKQHKNIHRLVAEHFIPNYSNKPVVNHINCDKTDNSVSNLEWVSEKENSEHAKRNNLLNRYENRPAAKLNKNKVLSIPELIKQGATIDDLAKLFNVSRRCIDNIFEGKNWTDLGIDFTKLKPNKKVKNVPSQFKVNTELN